MTTDLVKGQYLECAACHFPATVIRWRPRQRSIRCEHCGTVIAVRANDQDPGRAVRIN